MVSSLSRLVDILQRGAVPSWVRDSVASHRREIANALAEGGSYTLRGPNGEEIEIRASKGTSKAA